MQTELIATVTGTTNTMIMSESNNGLHLICVLLSLMQRLTAQQPRSGVSICQPPTHGRQRQLNGLCQHVKHRDRRFRGLSYHDMASTRQHHSKRATDNIREVVLRIRLGYLTATNKPRQSKTCVSHFLCTTNRQLPSLASLLFTSYIYSSIIKKAGRFSNYLNIDSNDEKVHKKPRKDWFAERRGDVIHRSLQLRPQTIGSAGGVRR